MRQFLGNPLGQEWEDEDEFEMNEITEINIETMAIGHGVVDLDGELDLYENGYPLDSVDDDIFDDVDDDTSEDPDYMHLDLYDNGYPLDSLDDDLIDDVYPDVDDDVTSDDDPDYMEEENNYSDGSELLFGVDESSDEEAYDDPNDVIESEDYVTFDLNNSVTDEDEEHPPSTSDSATKEPTPTLSMSDIEWEEGNIQVRVLTSNEVEVHPPPTSNGEEVHPPPTSNGEEVHPPPTSNGEEVHPPPTSSGEDPLVTTNATTRLQIPTFSLGPESLWHHL